MFLNELDNLDNILDEIIVNENEYMFHNEENVLDFMESVLHVIDHFIYDNQNILAEPECEEIIHENIYELMEIHFSDFIDSIFFEESNVYNNEQINTTQSNELKIEVNDNDFQEKVVNKSNEIPVLVDFWAQWCMPCKMLEPVLERMVNEYKGKFILAKANLENSRATSQLYKIEAIPNVKLFKNGKPVAEFIGVVSEATIRKMLDENLR